MAGMPIDEDIRVYLESVADVPRVSEQSAPVSELRQATHALWAERPRGDFQVDSRDLLVPGRDGTIPVRLYQPADGGADGLVLYFHGGGFVFGDLDSHDDVCRRLSHDSGMQVLAVDYRLAPEHPFPAAVHDALDVLQWLTSGEAAAAVSAGRLFVAGDSAGANLAAVAANHARDVGIRLAGQALIYPVTDFRDTEYPSRKSRASGYGLSQQDMLWYGRQYLRDPELVADPRVSPITQADLAGVAPVFVMTAGYDPLCSEGEAYVSRLREAGTPVEHLHLPGANHGVFTNYTMFRSGEQTFQALLSWLQQRLEAEQATGD